MKKILLGSLIVGALVGGYIIYDNQRHKVTGERVVVSEMEVSIHESDNSDVVEDGGGDFDRIDRYALNTPRSKAVNLKTLANHLISGAGSEMGKVRAIFTWIAHNISYDDDGINTSSYLSSDLSAKGVLKRRTAVCEGFSNLFKGLCDEAGIEAIKIHGYAKGIGYTQGDKFKDINHAWNSIKIDGKWRLMDVTWAEGYSRHEKGKLVSYKAFDDYWFCVEPKEFIFSHLPEQSRWQLTKMPFTLSRFESFPDLGKSFFRLGFNTEYVYKNAINGKIKEFAYAYPIKKDIKVIALPYKRQLNSGSTFTFKITSSEVESIAVVNKGKWTYLNKDKELFSLRYTLKSGPMKIFVKYKGGSSYWTMLEYDVDEVGNELI